MQDIFVSVKTKDYKIHIREGFSDLTVALKEKGLFGGKLFIVTDSNVEKLYLDQVYRILEGAYSDIFTFSFEAGEKNKTLDTVEKIYEAFLENKMDRSSLVMALGGGVTGDMAAFAASTFMRGMKFIQVPTTLLSQVDSSVGGKTGVDYRGNKNLIGLFSQPELVYINIETLKTLPKEQVASGMAEVIKCGLIKDTAYYDYIIENKDKLLTLDNEAISEMVGGSCRIKADVVAQDETESKGIRELLNFGHTFGHAFETLSDFEMSHGEAVSVGMVAALYLSHKAGNISTEEFASAKDILRFYGLPTETSGYSSNDVLNKMALDKKTKNNDIKLILLKKIGEAFIYAPQDKEQILSAIKHVCSKESF